MRRTVKGAAAIAALSATALAFSSAAFADNSHGKLDTYRLAGSDRVQTAQEVLNTHKNTPVAGKVNIFVVNKLNTVDALALAPLAKVFADSTQSYVLYADKDGLDATSLATIKGLKGNKLDNVILIGGEGSVSDKAYLQIINGVYGDEAYTKVEVAPEVTYKATNFTEVPVYRIGGQDRYETAYLVGAVIQDPAILQDMLDIRDAERQKANADKEKADFEAAEKAAEATAKAAVEAEKELAAASKAVADFYAAHKLLGQDDFNKMIADLVSKFNADVKGAQEHLATLENLDKVVNEDVTKFVEEHKAELKKPNEDKVLLDAVIEKATELKNKVVVDAATALKELPEMKALVTAGQPESFEVAKQQALPAALENARKDLAAANSKVEEMSKILRQYMAGLTDKTYYEPGGKMEKLLDARDAAQKKRDAAVKAAGEAADALLIAADKVKKNPFVMSPYFADRELADMKKKLAEHIAELYGKGANPIVVARGDIFPDALTAGPAAASLAADGHGYGILLLSKGASLTEQVSSALKTPRSIYAVGGDAAAALGSKAVRVVGSDRYDTSVKVAETFYKNSTKQAYALTSGEVDADAVVAGAWVVSKGFDGILLTKVNELPATVGNFIQFGSGRGAAQHVNILQVIGGAGSVSAKVLSAAALAGVDAFVGK